MYRCFIIMPITTPRALLPSYRGDTDHFVHVLDHLFVPAIEKAGCDPIRPKIEGADVIHAKIIQYIEQSELVLCDMSALNPNVFFEIGIRTAVDKPACMVVDDITSNVPFDTSILNYHTYKSSLDPWLLNDEIEKLSSHILAAKEAGERNPLWHYFGLSTRAQFSENETDLEAKVDLMSMRLDGLARQLTDRNQLNTSRPLMKKEDSTTDLLSRLSDLASSGGADVIRAKGGTGHISITVDGVLPKNIKEKMVRLAEEFGYNLTIKKYFSSEV